MQGLSSDKEYVQSLAQRLLDSALRRLPSQVCAAYFALSHAAPAVCKASLGMSPAASTS